ncbi:MAG: hypothetical protein M3347_11080 [Armatimonadota bacterium]|nr:hypothetical protein [Armatimonadota bacterium]
MIGVLSLLTLCTAVAQNGDARPEAALVMQDVPVRPRASDVCFSSRWEHPRNTQDPYDTFQMADAFHATRLDWVYTRKREFIAKAQARGLPVMATLNANMSDTLGKPTTISGRIVDRAGQRLTAPWMREWPNSDWGCANSPEYRAIFQMHARACLDAGANSLHMDDPKMNIHAVQWGGCFCPHCMRGFSDYLARTTTPAQRVELGIEDIQTFDYRALPPEKTPEKLKTLFAAFQWESVTRFFGDMMPEVDRYARRHVPFSMNNYGGDWQGYAFAQEYADFGLAELAEDKGALPVKMRYALKEAARRQKAQVFTFVNEDVRQTRRVIATAYALGSHVVVPWDVYIKGAKRYFGRPEDFADLYGFVRGIAGYLDGYEEVAAFGEGLADDGDEKPPPVLLDDNRVYAFTRARKEGPPALAIHLVDWNTEAKPHTIRVYLGHLMGKQRVQVRLLQPVPYQEPLHAAAEKEAAALRQPGRWRGAAEAAAFARLVNTMEMPSVPDEHGVIEVQCPPLEPWGVLVVNAAPR